LADQGAGEDGAGEHGRLMFAVAKVVGLAGLKMARLDVYGEWE